MEDNARRAQLPALTGLRFIAALCVVVSHGAGAMTNVPGGNPLWHIYLTSLAAFGMTLFFVLSGFVIHYNYSEQITKYNWRGIMNFLSARFARLYPLYISRLYPLYILSVILVLYEQGVFANAWAGDVAASDNVKFVLPFYLTMTQSWIYAVRGDFSLIYQYPSLWVIQVSWSIRTEWFFYFVYPLICIILTRLNRTHLVGAALLTAAVALSGMAAAYHGVHAIDQFGESHFGPITSIAHGEQDSFFRWLVYFSPYARLPEFLVGCLVAALYRAFHEKRPSLLECRAGRALPHVALALAIVIDFIMYWPSHPYPFLSFLQRNFGFAVPVALLLFGLARYETALGRALSCSWMVACGDASYSIYLLHGLIIPSAGLAVLPVGQSIVLTSIILVRLCVVIVVIIGFSMVTYRIVEYPARRFLRHLLTIRLIQPGGELSPTLASG
jgi:peptidoglycan/LPS O-acetylase OafA/YrhL